MNKIVAIYTRNDKDGSELRDIFNSLKIGEYAVKIQDTGSGVDKNRKGLQQLIELIKNQEISEVHVTCLTQLSRDISHAYELIQLMLDNNIHFITTYGDADTVIRQDNFH